MAFFEDCFFKYPDYDLDAAFDFILDEFPNDFEEFYGLDRETVPEHLAEEPDDWEEFKRLHEVALRLANVARQFVRPRRLRRGMLTEYRTIEMEAEREEEILSNVLQQIREDLKNKEQRRFIEYLRTPAPGDARSKHRLFQVSMQLSAARMFFQWPGKQAARMLTLLDYIAKAPGEGARAYLARVAECYVREMRDEMAVMSRAVLEKALSERLPEQEARKHVRMADAERLGLGKWIRAARNSGILNEEAEGAAKRVKEAGDDAIHVLPGTGPNPEEILDGLAVVLGHLESGQSIKE